MVRIDVGKRRIMTAMQWLWRPAPCNASSSRSFFHAPAAAAVLKLTNVVLQQRHRRNLHARPELLPLLLQWSPIQEKGIRRLSVKVNSDAPDTSTENSSDEKFDLTGLSNGLEAAAEDKRRIVEGKTKLGNENFHLNSGSAMLPHPQKAKQGGEDAFFIEDPHWIGVADGVGGWALEGVNAGLYARELMQHCKLLAQQEQVLSQHKCVKPEPKNVLVKAAKLTAAVGSATALVATLFEQTLSVANIGDSGFIIVRDGKIIAKSNPMQKSFNFPYQIGSFGDDPKMAEVYEVLVHKGDTIIIGTDGLYDNVFDSKMVEVVKANSHHSVTPEKLASELALMAQNIGKSERETTPFSKAASALGYDFSGGKLDDVTVVVSYVT